MAKIIKLTDAHDIKHKIYVNADNITHFYDLGHHTTIILIDQDYTNTVKESAEEVMRLINLEPQNETTSKVSNDLKEGLLAVNTKMGNYDDVVKSANITNPTKKEISDYLWDFYVKNTQKNQSA